MKKIAPAALSIALALATATAGSARAQDANAYFAYQNAMMQQQTAAVQNQIVGRNMSDPRIVAMYRQAQMQGYDRQTGSVYRQDMYGNYYSCGNDGCALVRPAG